MDFDFAAILNSMMIAKVDQKNPYVAKILNVFAAKGIGVMDAMAMLMEISAIAEEMQENASEN